MHFMVTRIFFQYIIVLTALVSCSPPDSTGNGVIAEADTVSNDSVNYRGRVSLENKGYYKKLNTELGMLNVGNFDFYFDGKKVTITAKFKFRFESKIPEEGREPFKKRFFGGIKDYWCDTGIKFVRISGKGYPKTIPLEIVCYEDTGSYHKIVDVRDDERRAYVFMDMNMSYYLDRRGIAHEFGHVLGLYDNYDGGTLENSMVWHDNRYMDDVEAMMNRGVQLRKRYFEHFLKELNSIVGNCRYRIKADFQ